MGEGMIDLLYLKAYERMVQSSVEAKIEVDINARKFVEQQKRTEEAAAWEKADHSPERPESFGTWS